MNAQPPVIAIDGPGGSGKGTVSREVAAQLGWCLLDSGALYRVLAVAAHGLADATLEPQALKALAESLDVEFGQTPSGEERILLEGLDVTKTVRSEACGNRASELAVIPEARAGLLDLQRRFRRWPGLVADGRDMGTVVFPDAGLKIFLTASAEERAKRRYNQLKEKGLNANLAALFGEITARDERDQNRAISPLRPAPDAVLLDSTGLPVLAVVTRILELAAERLGVSGAAPK